MRLTDIIKNNFTLISSAILVVVPCYAWKTLYHSYEALRNKYEELLFHKRHDCVVMCTENKGMSECPPHTERIKLDIYKENCLLALHEPILHFINTAKKSLDVAFMLIGINSVYVALLEAHKRGVEKLAEIRNLLKEGIELLLYILRNQKCIMHYKFMIKDYSESSGYIFTGSLNLSNFGFLNNYEDIVFISNLYIARLFHENIEDCWNYIKTDNENFINKTILLDAETYTF